MGLGARSVSEADGNACEVRFLPALLDGWLVRLPVRSPVSRTGQMGSTPIRATVDAGWTGVWFPARSHKPHDVGSNPTPATGSAEYANRHSEQVENLCSVGSSPTSVTDDGPVVQRLRRLAYTQDNDGSSPSGITGGELINGYVV